jgi:hypothetical protein
MSGSAMAFLHREGAKALRNANINPLRLSVLAVKKTLAAGQGAKITILGCEP